MHVRMHVCMYGVPIYEMLGMWLRVGGPGRPDPYPDGEKTEV